MKPVVTTDTHRDITSIILAEAAKHGFDPIGFVAGAIGESSLRERAAREAVFPDVSFGLWQPSVAFLTDEVPGLTRGLNGIVLNTADNRQIAREFCFDAERLAAYVAPKFARLLHDFGNDSVEAWCRWNAPNLPGSQNPNLAHIKASHDEAEQFREDGDAPQSDVPTLELPPLTFIGCHPDNFAHGRGGIKPEAIVLHIAEGSLGAIDNTFLSPNPNGPASTHFAVGKDGTIHQYVNTGDTAFGQGIIEPGFTAELITENEGINPNKWTISIEHEGVHDVDLVPTPAQFEASAHLTAWLFRNRLFNSGATGVAVDGKHILGHRDIAPHSRKNDPPWDEGTFMSYINTVRAKLGLSTE